MRARQRKPPTPSEDTRRPAAMEFCRPSVHIGCGFVRTTKEQPSWVIERHGPINFNLANTWRSRRCPDLMCSPSVIDPHNQDRRDSTGKSDGEGCIATKSESVHSSTPNLVVRALAVKWQVRLTRASQAFTDFRARRYHVQSIQREGARA